MPRLSIAIPVVGQVEACENTLVSVLANRPRDCEVLAVFNAPYADTYQIADEVRLIHAENGCSWAQVANLAVTSSRGAIVHLLEPGAEVSENWCESPLAHFRDPRVASVAPVVQNLLDLRRVLSYGVGYRAGGARYDAGENTLCEALGRVAPRALGPARWAGFYRRDVLLALGEPFAPEVGAELADVDLALRLAHAGFEHRLEPDSIVRLAPAPRPLGYRHGLQNERLFWRSAPVSGWLGALVMHLPTIVGDVLRSLPTPGALSQLLGRAAALAEPGRYLRHYAQLAGLVDQAQMQTQILSMAAHGRDEASSTPESQPAPQRLRA